MTSRHGKAEKSQYRGLEVVQEAEEGPRGARKAFVEGRSRRADSQPRAHARGRNEGGGFHLVSRANTENCLEQFEEEAKEEKVAPSLSCGRGRPSSCTSNLRRLS